MIGKRKFGYAIFMSVMLMIWLCVGAAYSQPSTNYTIPWDVLDEGGGTIRSTNYLLTSSIGQLSGPGDSSSSSYTNHAGFVNENGGSGTAPQYVFTFVKQGTGTGVVTRDGIEIDSGFTDVYDVGTELTLQAVPDANSDFIGWSGGCTGTDHCVVTVNSDKVVTATFALKDYTIAASAGEGGVIEPPGDITVDHGADKTFTITPDEGYELVDVLVDTRSEGAITEYTFTNVTADHTIEAIFAINTFTITASAGDGGSISPKGKVTVNYRTDQTFTISPNVGYQIEAVLVDDALVEEMETYTETEGEISITKVIVSFTSVTTNHTIEARFSEVDNGGSFVYEDWNDAEKSLINPDDDWMCWAAAAANILGWAGWDTPMFGSAQDIFYTFQDYWTNAGGLMSAAWQWWFDGTDPEDWPGWAQVDVPNGGNYWSDYNFFDYLYEDWAVWDDTSNEWSDGSHLMATIDEYLNHDLGITLAIYSESGGHALSVWGYEFDAFGNYTGIYVTDSDDYITDLKLLSVDLVDDLWYLDIENQYGYADWFIGGIQALAQNPAIPEPGTVVLIGFGLLGLLGLGLRRWSKRASKSA